MDSLLWLRAEHEVRQRLEGTEGIELISTADGLHIAAPAFRVWMALEEGDIIVGAGEKYHEHYQDPAEAANCLCWFLTPYYRLVEDFQGDRILQAFVERFSMGKWEAMAHGPIFLMPGEVVQADRRVYRQHALTSPGPMQEIDPWLDEDGLPPETHLGERIVEVDHEVGISPDELRILELLDADDPMFGELLGSLYAEEGDYDLIADEFGFEVRPHAPETFAVRVERVEGENRVVVLGHTSIGDPMQIAGLAVLLLSGFARVVEEYAGERRKSIGFQIYGPEGWIFEDRGPEYASLAARLLRTTERRVWQQRVETGLQIASDDDVDLDDDGWPQGSRWGCHIE